MFANALKMTTTRLTIRRAGRRVPSRRNVPLFGQSMRDISQQAARTTPGAYSTLMGV